MALVNVTNVIVLDNPTHVSNPFQFDITFECLQELPEDLEFRLTYVGSAEDTSKDQVLEEVLVGPLVVGINRFVLTAPAPDLSRIAQEDLIGVTVVLISCFYQSKEFLKIGYYTANEYMDENYDPENPPATIDMSLLRRNIAADQPRVTRIPIDWYAGHDENVPYTEADPNLLEDEPIAQEGDEEDDEGEEMDGDEAEEDDDVDMIMSGGEDSMDVGQMQNQLIRNESN